MNFFEQFGFPVAKAICYSGFRDGQQPGGVSPSYDEVKDDLLILQKNWKYLRLYDCDTHAETVLQVISKENFDFKIMLGAFIEAEMNNFGCPWGGGVYEEEQLVANRKKNEERIQKLIDWANKFPDIIFSLSVGNEACVDWTDHYVPVKRVIEFVRRVKKSSKQPVTFCENYVPWLSKLKPLTAEVDFISIHTYPVWEYKHIHEAIEYTRANYEAVLNLYPEIPVVITEAGWATNSNGRGIQPEQVNEENQKTYFEDLMNWSEKNKVLTFFFEAFDEAWKGSSDPNEPEKHWGLFHTDRTPKIAMK
ncbi:MAG: glycosyl hydrolase [Chitinophagaceae bacterium]|jgi:exo-beta-1,3-glucanase (GH17 family)|nr:glycosyl hydrolase [Chitinophagaceae bacterium]MBK7679975.1 glycosyl hydrolase [Chitinophagaceae bacterium]MBK9465661.1 glycosyl hydrolase [Chitinophagaceae bacterium]MBK9660611.1 glycosyl hydrolase [Chitinophagaceae bacterium]MBK9937682.1 glycosyl hydrolase [Chitinophagaceae bacterium]